MIDFIKSIWEASRQRLKSPILGTYTISFILVNWRPFLFLLFSKASIEDKIIVINSEYCCWEAILYPLAMTMIITFVVPYFMWLVDLGLIKSKYFRRKIRHDEKVIGLDNEIIIATKEFEIQNRKSGTKTIETLQDNISLLEKEKQALTQSNNTERETNSNEISRLNDLLKNEIEKNSQAKSKNVIEFSESVFETYNYLQENNNLKEFYDNFDGYSSQLALDDSTIRYYRDLGLVRYENGHVYTKLGIELYHFLLETYNSREKKKRMINIMEKFSNRELQILKSLESKDGVIFSLPKGFRETTLSELIDARIFQRVSSSAYTLTKDGNVFRNLVALNRYLD